MKRTIKGLAKRIPQIKRLLRERDELRETLNKLTAPPGHYNSPIPSIEEIKENEERIFRVPRELPALDLNEEEQLRLFEAFARHYKELPFEDEKKAGLRYYFNNPSYSYSDAICLYSMIRHVKPRRIIEVGSGFSSCVTLDTNELFFGGAIACTFIDPYPKRLLSLIKEADKESVEIITAKVQDVGLERFSGLERNDILFIDSTHISKTGSDVNYIFFEILPSLKSGVYIHFHDIFYPFEYPREWVYGGWAWNEDYLLRAFLQYNDRFKIVFFNTFLEQFYADRFKAEMPLCMKNPGGSIWLKKM